MSRDKEKSFSIKHGPSATVDPRIQQEIEKSTSDLKLPCAVAFKICKDLDVTPEEVGKTADLMNYPLVKCQLGLFGYGKRKRIVEPKEPEDPNINIAIKDRLEADRLPCRSAWEIAKRFNTSKMTISGACEVMGIKIKPCQLGAF
jgi:hypothetical protein